MKREKKNKNIKKLLVIVVSIIVVIAIIVLIVKNASKLEGNKQIETDKSIKYDLPSTTYNNMEVTNIELEYIKDSNQTMVTMLIKNTTGKAIEQQQQYNVKFLDKNDEELLAAGAAINPMEIGAETSTSLILTGDFTSIKKVILEDVKPLEETTATSTEEENN